MEGSNTTHTFGSFSTLGTLKVAIFAFPTPAILETKAIEGGWIDGRDLREAIAVDLSSLEGETLVSISTWRGRRSLYRR